MHVFSLCCTSRKLGCMGLSLMLTSTIHTISDEACWCRSSHDLFVFRGLEGVIVVVVSDALVKAMVLMS